MSDIKTEIRWEKQMVDQGVDKYHAAMDAARFKRTANGYELVNDESATSYGISLMKEVTLPYEDYIRAFVDTAYKRMGQRDIAAAYIARCEVREVAYIAAKTIVDSITAEVNQTELCFRIAGKLEDQMRLTRFHEDYKYYFESICADMAQRGVKNYRHKRKVLTHCHKKVVEKDKAEGNEVREWVPWPKHDKVHIGVRLIELFIQATGLIERKMRRVGGNTIYHIRITELGEEFIKNNKDVCQYLHPERLPTLIPPLEWSTPWNGGYHTQEMRRRQPLVSMKPYTRKTHSDLLRKAEMPEVYETVNAAQNTAWCINEFVLEQFVEEMRVHGIGCPVDINEPAPESPHPFPDQGKLSDIQYRALCEGIRANLTADEQADLAEWRELQRDWYTRRQSNLGKIMSLTHVLRTAKQLALKEKFYYVHKLDSRGRIYAVGSHVNPQGADASKAMLQFHDATPLGRWGYWHLVLHAAGVFGYDKVSLEERLAWVHNNAQRIMDTWADPGQTRDFWGAADKPYLFLAVCKELADIWMMYGVKTLTIVNRKDTEWIGSEFKSRIPCSQDGSCNGLQHFSAMLRDPIGSMAVNLMAAKETDKPHDIYGETAALVLEYIIADLEGGVVLDGKDHKTATDEDQHIMRLWTDVLVIDRKLCKRSTMVVPYGGQKNSCLEDVVEVMSDKLDKLAKNGTPVNLVAGQRKAAARMMSHYVWKALDVVVVAARKAMKFLARIATINNRAGVGFSWTTPVGFVAWQDKKHTKSIRVTTKINGEMDIRYLEATDEIDEHKQRNSFPPNFVHSLDATHMVKTVTAALDLGISNFGLVHDSYAVPAGQCEAFHACIREQFVDLYERDVLFRVVEEQKRNHPNLAGEYPSMEEVEPGSFDLRQVLQSPYFFR